MEVSSAVNNSPYCGYNSLETTEIPRRVVKADNIEVQAKFLGYAICFKNDVHQFKVFMQEKSVTRRMEIVDSSWHPKDAKCNSILKSVERYLRDLASKCLWDTIAAVCCIIAQWGTPR
jgi:beta-galactosidase beta subunit